MLLCFLIHAHYYHPSLYYNDVKKKKKDFLMVQNTLPPCRVLKNMNLNLFQIHDFLRRRAPRRTI